MSSLPKGASTRFRSSKSTEMYLASGLPQLGGEPGADVDDAGHLGGDGVGLEVGVGVGRDHEPVA